MQFKKDYNVIVRVKAANTFSSSTTIAAASYQSQTLNINTSKLWSYKLNDDIFQRKSILPDGKNHGMVMMVDWSGSMFQQLYQTVVQVITLATFARRVGIPFDVYNFTDVEDPKKIDDIKERNQLFLCDPDNEDTISVNAGISLRHILSHKMTNSEFSRACDNYLFLAWSMKNHFYGRTSSSKANSLGGTPLVSSLILFEKVIAKFQKQNMVEKMSFIVLTDGEASDGISYVKGCTTNEKYQGWNMTVSEWQQGSTVVFDERTKKNVVWTREGSRYTRKSSTEFCIKLISELNNAKSIGFYICDNTRDLNYAIQSYCVKGYDYGRKKTNSAKKEVRKNGFITAEDCGYDEYYIIDQRTQHDDAKLDIDETMTKAKIARNFSKFQSKKKTSRQMLNKFVDLVK